MKTLEQLLTDESLQDIRPVIMQEEKTQLLFRKNQVITCSNLVWEELNAMTDDKISVVDNIKTMALDFYLKAGKNKQSGLPNGNELIFSSIIICEKATMTRSYKAIAKRLDFSENWKDVTALLFIGQHESLETLAPPQSEDQTTETKEV